MEKVKETKEELLDKERLLFFFEKEEELEFELEARVPKYAVGPSKRQQYFRARLYRRSLIREGKPVPKYLKPYQSGEY
ncbi:unnamed protein product [Cyprideis torosa]|uniref:Uncharacterized protein n=1 Tax=Cyprideis torosa TaxID=163714 RepID=A0A7R8ZKZ8_9CRUS|nr:unnamed protein product [Cyprideis torosa]CAG0885474.1 unnamed protein product [Cyprideis torosa]